MMSEASFRAFEAKIVIHLYKTKFEMVFFTFLLSLGLDNLSSRLS